MQRQTLKVRIAEARVRGARAGKNAASWVFDGNTSDATYHKVARMMADGDPQLDDIVAPPAWLSGEWAGESITELLGDLLRQKDSDQDVEAAYVESADNAFWAEIERDVARHTSTED